MSKSVRIALIIVSFLITAFFLGFRLGKGDPVTDEVELAFRALGDMDFFATPFQTTPLEWFSGSVWWTHLSFHDHPPVIFALGHLVFKMFGDSLLTLRIPFAILGLGSLVLLYLFSRKLFDEKIALIALAIAAVNTYLTWIGRIGLQEELVIFFNILSLYLLTKVEQRRIFFIFWGIAFGLGVLSKYTAVIILPVSILYLWYFNPIELKKKSFYLSLLLAVLVFSPVLIYNVAMYHAVGHFDLQLSSLLHENVSAHWQTLPGKQIGTIWSRLATFYPNLWNNDLPFALLFLPSLIFLLFLYARSRLGSQGKFLFWVIILYHLLITVIGPSQRFLVMLVPWGIIVIAYALFAVWKRNRLVFYVLIVSIFIYQVYYNFAANLSYSYDTESAWRYSKLRLESGAFGYNELENYLVGLLDTKKPAVKLGFPTKLKFVESFRAEDFRGISENPEAPYLVIYDPRVNQVAKLWLYDRRYYYDGWPFVSVDEFLTVQKVAPQYFSDLGVKDYFYIAATEATFVGAPVPHSQAAKFEQERFLDEKIVAEKEIVNRQGQKVFSIYRFSL